MGKGKKLIAFLLLFLGILVARLFYWSKLLVMYDLLLVFIYWIFAFWAIVFVTWKKIQSKRILLFVLVPLIIGGLLDVLGIEPLSEIFLRFFLILLLIGLCKALCEYIAFSLKRLEA